MSESSPIHPGLRISVEAVAGRIIVAPAGELDLATAGKLARALARAQAAATHTVVLDLHEMTFMDIAGMRVIRDADAHARREGRVLDVVRCSSQVRRVFALCQTIDLRREGGRRAVGDSGYPNVAAGSSRARE